MRKACFGNSTSATIYDASFAYTLPFRPIKKLSALYYLSVIPDLLYEIGYWQWRTFLLGHGHNLLPQRRACPRNA